MALDAQWVAIIISGAIGLIGVLAAVASVAFFSGQMKAALVAQEKQVELHDKAQSVLQESFKQFYQQGIDALMSRLNKGDDLFGRLTDQLRANEIATMRATDGLNRHERQCDERQDRSDARFSEMQNQLSAIARARLGEIRS